ncbi:MAG: hypothetical protein AAF921_04095 [Cyanobacteria bacterium P01_D01_bin.44]
MGNVGIKVGAIAQALTWQFALLLLIGCGSDVPVESAPPAPDSVVTSDPDLATPTESDVPVEDSIAALADVTAYEVSGEPGAYTLSVTVSSPDTGCQQYADWWEVTDQTGTLIYRRILAHSHIDEQPFSRSGGPVDIQPDQIVIIRAHMNSGGYGGQVFQGTVAAGLNPAPHPPDFALDLAAQPPLPEGCAF